MQEPEYFFAEVEALSAELDGLASCGASEDAKRAAIEREASRLGNLADHHLHFWLHDEMARLSDLHLGNRKASVALE